MVQGALVRAQKKINDLMRICRRQSVFTLDGAGLPSPSRSADVVPAFGTTRTPALRQLRGSISRLRYLLPTLYEHVAMQGSLPAGG